MTRGDAVDELTVAVVILTTGTRSEELMSLARSLDALPVAERVLVVNSTEPTHLPGWTTVVAGENLGVPGGRTRGVQETTADVIIFLDDDSVVTSHELAERVERRFRARPDLGALGFRVETVGGGPPLRRWLPARSAAEPDGLQRSASFPGNGHALRRNAFVEVGGYCNELFFKHEETELSWKLLDAGWTVAFDEECVVQHPATAEGRHANALRIGVRNKVWIARQALPAVLVPISVLLTALRYFGRCRRIGDVHHVRHGLREGLGELPAARKPMRWQTVWLLTKLGRPPIL